MSISLAYASYKDASSSDRETRGRVRIFDAYYVGTKRIIGAPKSKQGQRKIELPDIPIKALIAHRERMLAEGNHTSWVFCMADGEPIKKNSFRKSSFLPILAVPGVPKIRFHDLRHTAASLLLAQGVYPKVVQERLGHAQISITLDIYSHVLPSMQKEAAAKIDQMFNRAD